MSADTDFRDGLRLASATVEGVGPDLDNRVLVPDVEADPET